MSLQNPISVDTNFTELLFTPSALELLSRVIQELTENSSIDSVEEAYCKILGACKEYNNGVTLLALAEVLVALISTNAVNRKTDIPQVKSES